MMFSCKSFRLVLALAAAFNAVTSATEIPIDLGDAENYVMLTKSGTQQIPQTGEVVPFQGFLHLGRLISKWQSSVNLMLEKVTILAISYEGWYLFRPQYSYHF